MFTTLSSFIAPILAQERLAFIDPTAFPLAGAIRCGAEKETNCNLTLRKTSGKSTSKPKRFHSTKTYRL